MHPLGWSWSRLQIHACSASIAEAPYRALASVGWRAGPALTWAVNGSKDRCISRAVSENCRQNRRDQETLQALANWLLLAGISCRWLAAGTKPGTIGENALILRSA